MSFKDGILVGGKHSFEDFGLVINSREIGYPEKKSIRKTVPFMNGFYDYSKLYGDPAWGERVISYTFDVIGFTVEEMEEERTRVVNWLCNIHDEDIFDDAFPDYHFHGSFDSISPAEEGEQATMTFSFVCYPFMIANVETARQIDADGTLQLVNNGMPVMLKAVTSGPVTVKKDGVSYSVPAGEHNVLKLEKGQNMVEVARVNQINYPYVNTTLTNNGITFTDNGDGTITANGTSTEVAWFWLWGSGAKFKPPVGKHRAVGCPVNVGSNNYRIQYYVYNGSDEASEYYYDFGSGVTIDITEQSQYISMAIRIVNGYTADNVVFHPQMFGEAVISFQEEVI